MTVSAAPVPLRASWRPLAFGIGAFLLVPLLPPVRAILPIEQTALMLAAAVAACAFVGWIKGGRLTLALVWLAIAGIILMSTASPAKAAYISMARGWILLLSAGFGVVSMLARTEGFFSRALGALAVSTVFGFGVVLVAPRGADTISAVMSTELQRRVNESTTALHDALTGPGFKEIANGSSSLQEMVRTNEAQLNDILKWSTMLVPAMLALESLAALGLGWSLYHRMSEVPIGPSLGRLADFRFNDQLVWGVAVGASVFLLKAFADGKNAGLNLLVFFGFLYSLRGMGVLTWMARSRALRVMLLVSAIFWPIWALAFGIGIGDTWLDWRSRAAKPL